MGAKMRAVNLQELKSKFSEYLKLAQQEDVIIIYRGKPKAILRGLKDDEWEDYVIANHPEIRASIQQAQQEIREGKSVDLSTFMKEIENAG
ncbi:TPA: type II toxin-antitoxin system Phd/YefM family antitoxin [Candidatus Poribacteria bacterium]|nr:type II toxin-antitoxin system Phd/YefM family antitoxin [Candidatus Poribacteria bacterium]HEX29821.1 type II toxin-antitoxin system Phd/YefM family antitoxin [Candidatus Poribacteria bacterium]